MIYFYIVIKKSKDLGPCFHSPRNIIDRKEHVVIYLYFNNSITEDMEQENKVIFLDSSDDKWNIKKRSNIKYVQALERLKSRKKDKINITRKTIDRVKLCARYLEFGINSDGCRKIIRAQLCRNRFCPICVWRRTKKIGHDNAMILSEFMRSGGHLIFLTFTVKNCKYSDLRRTIKDLNAGIARLRQRKAIKQISLGDIKTLEITVNLEDRSFHPHIHLIVAVPCNYFKSNNPDYLTHEMVQSMWQNCMKSDTYLFVNIKAINDVKGSVFEISKYIAKDSDYLFFDNSKDDEDVINEKDKILYYLYNGTKNLRFLSYTGIFQEIRRELRIKDIDEQNEAELLGLDSVENDFVRIENYMWHYGFSRYILYEYEEFERK